MGKRGKNRQRLLDEGLRLFSERGFTATGVQQITDASAVPKGSFYNYFDSKEGFAAEVLSHYQQQQCAELEALLFAAGGSPLGRLKAAFERWSRAMCDAGFAGGCLAGRLAQELAGEVPELRQPLDRVFACMRGYVAECLREARDAGEIGDGLPEEVLAEFILNAWQGALQRSKAAGDAAPLRTCVDVVFGQLLRPA